MTLVGVVFYSELVSCFSPLSGGPWAVAVGPPYTMYVHSGSPPPQVLFFGTSTTPSARASCTAAWLAPRPCIGRVSRGHMYVDANAPPGLSGE